MTTSANLPYSDKTEFFRDREFISARVPPESLVEYSP
jgi:hypothetical protein